MILPSMILPSVTLSSRAPWLSVPMVCLALAGCAPAAGPVAEKAANDGVAQKLTLGVSRAEADVALGIEAGFERNPMNYDEECVSYAYGDGKYVHAVFRGGALVQRSDGHRSLCTYGSLIGG
jgi:hypothetical protein